MDKTLKTCFLLLMTIVPVFFCSCIAQELKKEKGKLLIVYLSRTNNTKQVAEIIQKEVGGDLVALELKEPYPENYDSIVAQVAKENESGYLPPLKTRIDNFNQYDKVFVGFPTWGMQLPPPMKSFLNKYNMSGKTVIPFNTNAGYGVGSSFKTVKEMCPNATVLEGFSTKGGIERDGIYFVMKGDKKIKVKEEIMTWLRQIKFL
ncbi:MAG: flavodoxin [Galbibacter orientalis]|uniref:flavodoxin n=1 Tax=Galbibacter orientalis TaxID=453852 RepID=UPI003001B871